MAPLQIIMIPLMLIVRAIPIAVVAEILRRICRLKAPSAIQYVALNIVGYLIGIVIGGYGHADGGEPKFALAAQEYLLPTLLLTIFNLVRLNISSKTSIISETSVNSNATQNVVNATDNQRTKKILKLLLLWILGIISVLGVLVSVNDYPPNYVVAIVFLLIGLPSFVRGYRVIWYNLMS